jgi:hypothetical protein
LRGRGRHAWLHTNGHGDALHCPCSQARCVPRDASGRGVPGCRCKKAARAHPLGHTASPTAAGAAATSATPVGISRLARGASVR